LKEAVLPIALTGYPTTHDFLTYSSFKGAPYLYYGFATADIEGSDREQLFELGALQVPSPDPLPGLPEVTAGGDSYSDPCNGSTIRYWSHYYSGNTHGLNNMVPRIGKLSSGGYFYRAAIAILDVHLVPPPPRIFSDGFETGDVTAWSQAVNPN